MKLLWELQSELNRLFLFELEDGSRVESVFYRGDTLCLSTQWAVLWDVPSAFQFAGTTEKPFRRGNILPYKLLKDKLPIKR
jgi:hypothetical protein